MDSAMLWVIVAWLTVYELRRQGRKVQSHLAEGAVVGFILLFVLETVKWAGTL